VAEMLLKGGANINATDSEGRTALHCAVSSSVYGQVTQVAEVLLKGGADINATDSGIRTPPHYAVLADNDAAAERSLNCYFVMGPTSKLRRIRT